MATLLIENEQGLIDCGAVDHLVIDDQSFDVTGPGAIRVTEIDVDLAVVDVNTCRGAFMTWASFVIVGVAS